MKLQRLVEIELLRLASTPGSLQFDSEASRLSCVCMLYRLGLIDDRTYLSASVSIMKMFES